MEKARRDGPFPWSSREEVPCRERQAVASQYSALKGLLMRSARGETSNNLSVGMRSTVGSTGAISMPEGGVAGVAPC